MVELKCPLCGGNLVQIRSLTNGTPIFDCIECGKEFLHQESNNDIDWHSFRIEAAMRAMQSLINNQKATHDKIQAIVVAQNAVGYADALIVELKKPQQTSLSE